MELSCAPRVHQSKHWILPILSLGVGREQHVTHSVWSCASPEKLFNSSYRQFCLPTSSYHLHKRSTRSNHWLAVPDEQCWNSAILSETSDGTSCWAECNERCARRNRCEPPRKCVVVKHAWFTVRVLTCLLLLGVWCVWCVWCVNVCVCVVWVCALCGCVVCVGVRCCLSLSVVVCGCGVSHALSRTENINKHTDVHVGFTLFVNF